MKNRENMSSPLDVRYPDASVAVSRTAGPRQNRTGAGRLGLDGSRCGGGHGSGGGHGRLLPLGVDRDPRASPLESLHDHQVVGFEVLVDHPQGPLDRPGVTYRCSTLFSPPTTSRNQPPWSYAERALGHQQGVRVARRGARGSGRRGPDRSRCAVRGWGRLASGLDRARAGIDRRVGVVDRARMREARSRWAGPGPARSAPSGNRPACPRGPASGTSAGRSRSRSCKRRSGRIGRSWPGRSPGRRPRGCRRPERPG